MTEPEPSPAPDSDPAPDHDHPPPAPAAPGRLLRLAIFLLALAFGAWGLWRAWAPVTADPSAVATASQRARIGDLEQQVATLTRSDQISRDANRDLQGTLAERDEEIAGLRADVAFYERFVGATGQRRGLTVHQLQLQQPESGLAWHVTTTLTQNLNRGAVSQGRVTLGVEGTQDGKLRKLAWSDLRQQSGAPGLPYSFKYFQEVEGDLVLPAGFKPLRVTVRLVPQDGAAVEQSFSWSDATQRSDPGA